MQIGFSLGTAFAMNGYQDERRRVRASTREGTDAKPAYTRKPEDSPEEELENEENGEVEVDEDRQEELLLADCLKNRDDSPPLFLRRALLKCIRQRQSLLRDQMP